MLDNEARTFPRLHPIRKRESGCADFVVSDTKGRVYFCSYSCRAKRMCWSHDVGIHAA